MDELHRGHPGMACMKLVARSYLWWPGLDKELEECVCLLPNSEECSSTSTTSPVGVAE